MAGLRARLRWGWGRFRAMPPPEIPHRIREQLRRREDREGGLAARSRSLPSSLLTLPPPAWPVDEAALEAAHIPALAADVRALLEGPFTMLGQTWRGGSRTDWTLDPETGERWPTPYTFDIDFRLGSARRDVKLAWELGRLQHLQLLAARWRLSGDARCRDACLEDTASWIAENPPYQGIAYASGIELACRVASLLVIAGLLGPESIEAPLRADLWRTLSAHGAWLARYPSLYSSANNHRVAELGGLALLGCLAPELPGADAWRAEGLDGLAIEALRQILPDGVGVEQTPTYQAFTMEWMLVARRAASATGRQTDPRMDARLAAGADFLAALHDVGGHHPQIGDDDEGVVLRNTLGHERHAASIARAVSAALGRPELAPPGFEGPPDLRAALLGFATIPASARRPRSRHFAEGGYTTLRAGPAMLVFDHAPLGQAPLNAHGHADALSVWLHLHGRPALIEAGTHRYNGAPEWRRYARSTLAHNTASVDGAEQSDPSSGFAWARVAGVECVRSAPAEGSVEALHRGFAHLGVIHRRRVALDTTELRVDDDFEGDGVHRIEIAWHFAPDLALTRAGDGDGDGNDWIARRGGVEVLRFAPPPGMVGRLSAQEDGPGPGINAPSYNRVQPAPTLVFEGDPSLPVRVSVIFRFS